MATVVDDQPQKPQPEPIPPAKRKRLQKCFEHGSKVASEGKDADYAHTLFAQCVSGDPGNLVYLQAMLGNLQNKYNNNKKGSKLAGFKTSKPKGIIKKATSKEEWKKIIPAGLDVLSYNPWDVPTLTSMSKACQELGHSEAELAYLKFAMDADPKEPEINRVAAKALERQGQFDQAIACWHRVELALPQDEEAKHAAGRLHNQQVLDRAARERPNSTAGMGVEGDGEQQAQASAAQRKVLSAADQLRAAIKQDVDNPKNYVELADTFARENQFDEASKVIKQGLDATGNNLLIQEYGEELLIRQRRHQLAIAEKRAEADKTDEAKALVKKLKAELLANELSMYAARADRYPNNITYKFELALRLKKSRKFQEAISLFQEVRKEPKRKVAGSIELGDCFQFVKQHELAMKAYDDAINEAGVREVEYKKKALHRAGTLAMRDEDYEKANRYISECADMDFAYQDIAKLLDKLKELRENQ
ncbi:MAG: tetratricopeptide repeat protein [Pirellulales bacterium]|nr:tetratricopeptide repeat protein [Pirellulales bacterium]